MTGRDLLLLPVAAGLVWLTRTEGMTTLGLGIAMLLGIRAAALGWDARHDRPPAGLLRSWVPPLLLTAVSVVATAVAIRPAATDTHLLAAVVLSTYCAVLWAAHVIRQRSA